MFVQIALRSPQQSCTVEFGAEEVTMVGLVWVTVDVGCIKMRVVDSVVLYVVGTLWTEPSSRFAR
jgi:hypothetical protein